jgi:hypothetical protein
MAQIGWKQFSTRADIKHLPLHVQKKKFLIENNSRLQEDLHILSRMHGAAAAAGGSGGVAIDGPIAGALVRSNVGTAVTDANGNFKLPGKATGVITVTGGVDSITGLPYEGELVGYAEYKTISPITTFAHYLKEASVEDGEFPLTIDEAITKTFVDSFDYFGISLPIEDKDTILQKDYIKESIVNNNKVGISAQAVAIQIEAIAETIGVALDGSQQAKSAAKGGLVIPEFSVANRKRSAYKAFGRSASEGVNFEIPDILSAVIFTDPATGRPGKGGPTFTNTEALSTQLTQTKNELATLAKQEQYTNNYLTTRIQAVNRAQKTTIKNETRDAVENRGSFSSINEVSTSSEVEDALKQIEVNKENETTPTLDGEVNTITLPLLTKVFQQRKDEKAGTNELQQLKLDKLASTYYYFGGSKDLPFLLTKLESTYSPATFVGTSFPNVLNAIMPDIPIYLEITTSTAAFDIVTTYTFRPTQSNRKDAPGIQVNLRLSQITEKRTKKAIDHIVLSEVGTYSAIYTKDSDKENPITYIATAAEGKGGNTLSIRAGKVDPSFFLGRYAGASPSTLLALTSGLLGDLNIQNLVFEDNKLSIAIPASEGQEKAVLDINFTLA